MDSDDYSLAMVQGFGFATAFWLFLMFFLVCFTYDHGKYVGKLEAAAPELAAEKEAGK